jgi:hypothetical protein
MRPCPERRHRTPQATGAAGLEPNMDEMVLVYTTWPDAETAEAVVDGRLAFSSEAKVMPPHTRDHATT